MSIDARETARRIVDEAVREQGDYRVERAGPRPEQPVGPAERAVVPEPESPARTAARRIVAAVFDAAPSVAAAHEPAGPSLTAEAAVAVLGPDEDVTEHDPDPAPGPGPELDPGPDIDADSDALEAVFPDQLFAERPDTDRQDDADGDTTASAPHEPVGLFSSPTDVAARIVADVIAARSDAEVSNDTAQEGTQRLSPPTRVVERDAELAAAAGTEAPLVPDPDGPPPPPAEALAAARPVSRPVEDARLAAQPLEDEETRFVELNGPPRTGRWLLMTVIAALALAVLFPLAVAALRQLAAMS